jgi:hypothetical protein
MQKLLKLLLCSLSILTSFKCFSQNNINTATDALIGRFTRAMESDTREKISVHTDKWVYVAGETIWFKAYCQYQISQKLSRLSKTLFVDLVSDKDSIVGQLLLNNQRFMTGGRIVLPEYLTEGDYWLRAYTNEQLKKDVAAIFVKHIYILNPSNSNSILLKKNTERKTSDVSVIPQITFYPEGGSIIAGTDQIVAFRATDDEGNPLYVSGYLTNDEDSVLARFSTNSKGLGKFNYFDEDDVQYKVRFKDNNGHDLAKVLPNSDPNAARISITKQTDTSIILLVALGDKLFKEEASTTLMGFNKDKLIYAASGKGIYQLDISKKVLPEGESYFLLFNQQHQIVSERAFYLTKNNVNIDLKTDKANYQAREKVKLDISITDANNQPLLSLLSIAVTDDSLIKPALDMSQLVSEEKELQLLTRENRFVGRNWENAPSTHTDNDKVMLGIQGKVFDKKGVPQKNQVITLFSNKDTDEILVGTDTTNEAGHFNLPLPNYTDSMGIQLGVTNLKGSQQDVDIRLDSFLYPNFKTPEILKVKFNETACIPSKEAKNYFLNEAVAKKYVSNTTALKDEAKILKSVTVRTWKKKEYSYDESKRVSQFSQILSWDMMANGGIRNISNGLLTVHGVHMMGNKLNIHGPTSMSSTSEPLLVLDGAPFVFPADTTLQPESPLISFLNTYSVDDIDFIEVLTGAEAAYYGAGGGNGVILVNTRNGPRKIMKNSIPGLKQFFTKGYLNPILFVSPDYDKPEIKNSTNPDLRSTIYWNGDLLTDQRNPSVNFFTSDLKTTYSVIIKGVTVNGDIIYKTISIQRK